MIQSPGGSVTHKYTGVGNQKCIWNLNRKLEGSQEECPPFLFASHRTGPFPWTTSQKSTKISAGGETTMNKCDSAPSRGYLIKKQKLHFLLVQG